MGAPTPLYIEAMPVTNGWHYRVLNPSVYEEFLRRRGLEADISADHEYSLDVLSDGKETAGKSQEQVLALFHLNHRGAPEVVFS